MATFALFARLNQQRLAQIKLLRTRYRKARAQWVSRLRYRLHVQPDLLRASYEHALVHAMAREVPAELYWHWRDNARWEFPGIKTTSAHFAISCSALLQFFHMASVEKKPMMLPSKSADSVWHAWLAIDKAGLDMFLTTHLGKNIPHIEKKDMPDNEDDNPILRMADTWRAAHDYDNNPQFSGHLPAIFEADKLTGVPKGFWYERDLEDRRGGYFQDIDASGVPHPERRGRYILSWHNVHEAMTPERRALADAHLLREYREPHDRVANHATMLADVGIAVGTIDARYIAHQEFMVPGTMMD